MKPVIMLLVLLIWSSAARLPNASNSRPSLTGSPLGTRRSDQEKQKTFFFLQDIQLEQCLAGDYFTRCGLDTLWYVKGKSGSYTIHRKEGMEASDSDLCLSKLECTDTGELATIALEANTAMQLKTLRCDYCGAQNWDILGDSSEGYALAQDAQFCVGSNAERRPVIQNCDTSQGRFSVHFVSPADMITMASKGAAFVRAAAANDLKTVRALTQMKLDVNSRDWNDQTALIVASWEGHVDIVKFLLDNGADSNLRGKDQFSAVMKASLGGHLEILKLLHKANARFDFSTHAGATALWLAGSKGWGDVVHFCITEASADPRVTRTDGVSALIAAAQNGHDSCVRWLLEAGADVNTKDKGGVTALIAASEKGYHVIVDELLAHHAEVNALSAMSFSPLILASMHGHLKIVNSLLKAGAIVDLLNFDKVTAIMYAASSGYEDIVRALLRGGAQVNLRHAHGGTALFEAARHGSVPVIKALLEYYANPHIRDNDDVTTLMNAASQGHTDACRILAAFVPLDAVSRTDGTALMFAIGGDHVETAEYLISQGANVNILANMSSIMPSASSRMNESVPGTGVAWNFDNRGISALMFASKRGHISIVMKIVEMGGIVTFQNQHGETALCYAARAGHTDIVTYLIENGASPAEIFVDERRGAMSLLAKYLNEGNDEMALFLIKAGANTNYVEESSGMHVLIQAAYLGRAIVVTELLKRGVSPAVKNADGIGPLLASAMQDHADVVRALLADSRVDAEESDADGTTALMAACSKGHFKIVKLLAEHGGLINAQNNEGQTPLMFAYNGKAFVEVMLTKPEEFQKHQVAGTLDELFSMFTRYTLTVEYLIENGADLTLRDASNRIAADFDNGEHDTVLNMFRKDV
jgi:ankyrin repeat protein